MAASKYKLGLVSVRMGDIAGDGGMGTVLTSIGDTVAGSASLTTEEAQSQDFTIEESDSPVLSIQTEADKIVLNFSTYNASALNLQRLFGGTVSGEVWEAPDNIPTLEQSVELTWKQGGRLDIPRGQVKAKLDISFKKDALSKIDITVTVLQPTKVGEPRITIENV